MVQTVQSCTGVEQKMWLTAWLPCGWPLATCALSPRTHRVMCMSSEWSRLTSLSRRRAMSELRPSRSTASSVTSRSRTSLKVRASPRLLKASNSLSRKPPMPSGGAPATRGTGGRCPLASRCSALLVRSRAVRPAGFSWKPGVTASTLLSAARADRIVVLAGLQASDQSMRRSITDGIVAARSGGCEAAACRLSCRHKAS